MSENKPEKQIRKLLNSHYFNLQCCFILEESEEYKLFIKVNDRQRFIRVYKTDRGAKIAFWRLCHRYLYEGIEENKAQADWSNYYPPDSKWLNKKME